MKQLLAAAALVTLIASPAIAKSHQSRAGHTIATPARASTDVVVNGTVVGRDPDAAIRTQLFRAGSDVDGVR
jgi:hypothetical protein